MAARKTRATGGAASAAAEVPEAAYRINALLHTMRCIAQHEDRLCGLLHEIQRTSVLTPEMTEELRTLLEELPADEYTHDLNQVQEALA